MDSSEFIRACERGGAAIAEAVKALVRSHWDKLVRDVSVTLNNEHDALDVVQEAFTTAWRQCREFRGEAAVSTWVRAIARNAALTRLRGRRDHLPLTDEQHMLLPEVEQALRDAARAPLQEPHALVQERQALALLQSCFARFARAHPEHAAVMRWVALDGLSVAEVQQLLGRSPQATRQFISECRKKARVYLAPWYLLLRERQPQVMP
jgi:RNA polymerase sigma factor (sigma-70 family)